MSWALRFVSWALRFVSWRGMFTSWALRFVSWSDLQSFRYESPGLITLNSSACEAYRQSGGELVFENLCSAVVP